MLSRDPTPHPDRLTWIVNHDGVSLLLGAERREVCSLRFTEASGELIFLAAFYWAPSRWTRHFHITSSLSKIMGKIQQARALLKVEYLYIGIAFFLLFFFYKAVLP